MKESEFQTTVTIERKKVGERMRITNNDGTTTATKTKHTKQTKKQAKSKQSREKTIITNVWTRWYLIFF